MRFLSAAGPALRRRLRPPELKLIPPTEVVPFHGKLLADVYVPEGADGAPTALVLHGGGFVLGARDMSAVGVLAADLVSRGFVVVSVDYRLAHPWTRVRLSEQESDVIAAARWWSEAAEGYGGDPDRNALIGLSAGGALALLATPEARFKRFVGIYGAYDLELLPVTWASAGLLTRAARRHKRAERSPIHRGAFAQPSLLVHGTADTLTPPGQAERLQAVRDAAGLSTETVWIEGAVHGFLQDGHEHPHTVQALDAIGAFLEPLGST